MRQQANQSVWVVCPAYNEASTIRGVAARLMDAEYNVVVVDDGSADDTYHLVAQRVTAVLRHPINLGQGAALKTGLDFALSQGADVIVTFDSDGQHRTSDIPRLLQALADERADFALGSRFLGQSSNMPLARRVLLLGARWFTRVTTGLRLTDSHNGLRAFTRRGARALRLRQNRMAHASEILADIARSGMRYVEVPVTIDYTAYSLAKGQRAGDLVLILLDLFARKLHR
jgi:glycosyltransferase involved in cell wall biosynthesis